MSGPWEEYASAQPASTESGPWAEYAAPTSKPAPAAVPQTASRTQLPKVGQKQSRMDRFAMGAFDPFVGASQLIEHVLPEGANRKMREVSNSILRKFGSKERLPDTGIDSLVREREENYQAARRASAPQSITSLVTGQQTDPGFDGWRLTGNVLSPANLVAASRIPAAASLAGRIGVGAAAGAGTGALAPVTEGDFAAEKAKQMAAGAAGGAAFPALTSGLARVVMPKAASNSQLALLKQSGVRPTIGQTLGGRWNAAEEKLQSLPIMGDAITKARGKALDQFNSAAINRATGAVGQKVGKIGQDGVHEAGERIGAAYDDALSSFSGLKLDNQFAQDAAQLQQMAQNLVPGMRDKFDKTYRELVVGRLSPNGSMLPETFKKVDGELGHLAAQYGKSSVASEQEAGAAIKQLRTILQEQAKRNDPGSARKLKAADTAYANLVRVEGAAKAAKNNGGVFTPAQLNGAIQAADSSVRKRAVARGTALMQDLGNAGQAVLGNRVPNSGTTDRALMAGGAGFLINPAIPAGLLGGAGLYTSPVQRLLTGAVSSRPQSAQAIAEALKKGAPMTYPLGVQVGLGLLDQ